MLFHSLLVVFDTFVMDHLLELVLVVGMMELAVLSVDTVVVSGTLV